MYDELKRHKERIEHLEEVKDAHQQQIWELKKNEEKQDKDILELKTSYINLENTIMKENRETRQSYQAQTDRQWAFIEQVTGYKENESSRKHELKMHKFNHVSGILLKVFGAGGIAYLLIQDWLLTR